jgi:hypothetical protein
MPSVGFEHATPTTKRPQTYALDRAATEVGVGGYNYKILYPCSHNSMFNKHYTITQI